MGTSSLSENATCHASYRYDGKRRRALLQRTSTNVKIIDFTERAEPNGKLPTQDPAVHSTLTFHHLLMRALHGGCAGTTERCRRKVINNQIEAGTLYINERNSAGRTPLHVVLYEMRAGDGVSFDKADYLYKLAKVIVLTSGADVNAQDSDDKTAHISVDAWPKPISIDLIALLVSHGGADVNKQDKCGYTPLHLAAMTSRWDVLDQLLLANVDVNVRCFDNMTPLHFACSPDCGAASVEVIRKLRTEHTVNVQCSVNGSTPLHVALCAARYTVVDPDILRLLITDQNVSYRDQTGCTPLHLALAPNCVVPESIVAMLTTEETLLMPDHDGYTPIDLSRNNRNFNQIYFRLKHSLLSINKRRGHKRRLPQKTVAFTIIE